MGIDRDIVIVSQFSVPDGHGGGSRGGTPGKYVTRYMAREGATEILAPVRRDAVDTYIERYMARESAVDAAVDARGVAEGMGAADGRPRAGVAFSESSISLSSADVRERSREIQDLFEAGHTVMKTVISFDTDYLRREGVCDADFSPTAKGDWKGRVDQLKLRRAVTNGLSRIAPGFDDLRWIGVIQVDTMHVHCHLAMVDAGTGTLREDGTQRGKLTQRELKAVKRSIDMELDRQQVQRNFSSQATSDRQQARALVKRWVHDEVSREEDLQFIRAALPSDKRKWRAGSHAKDMRRANALAREAVTRRLDGSPAYDAALETLRAYARARAEREELDRRAEENLFRRGRERLIDSCVDALYGELRAIDDGDLSVETPFMDIASTELDELVRTDTDDVLVRFAVRLRSFSSRLRHHTQERDRMRALVDDWDDAYAAGAATEESRAMRDLFEEEADYNARLMAKYHSFLTFVGPEAAGLEDRIAAWRGDDALARGLMRMADDGGLEAMEPEEAEREGERRYGVRGGGLMPSGAAAVRARGRAAKARADAERAGIDADLEAAGLVETPDGTVEAGQPYPFEEVKALDMHHLSADFPRGADVGERSLGRFGDRLRMREAVLDAAERYLRDTGQTSSIVDGIGRDVDAMAETYDEVSSTGRLENRLVRDGRIKRARVQPIDMRVSERVRKALERALADRSAGVPQPDGTQA